MANRNWSAIRTGETFEALLSTLVYFEDPATAVLSRAGVDGGQDVISGDGETVYQAKFHSSPSASKVIADAKAEAEKIKRYKDPSHPRQAQWSGVKNWRLATNAEFNTADHHRWLAEVEPLFGALALTAAYWERGHLDALLDKYPEVSRSFFGGEPRAVLTLTEARALIEREIHFLPRATHTVLYGRDAEVAAVVECVKTGTGQFLVLHGPGGVGKTRLMLESGAALAAQGWQVLWANKETMLSGRWYDGLVAERPTVLLVDEPDDEKLLKQLVEQVGVGRTTRWQVIVTVRSPKDPVLKFMGRGRNRYARFIEVDRIAEPAAKAFAKDLIEGSTILSKETEGWKVDASDRLSRQFDRFPIWITLAVELLERNGSLAALPSSAEDLAEAYLTEILRQQDEAPRGALEALLRWLALLETVNNEDDGELESLREVAQLDSKAALQACLDRLVQRRAAMRRGARSRLLEVKPDVIRDHILRRWLLQRVEYPTPALLPTGDAIALISVVVDAIADGSFSDRHRRVLRSMARCEALLDVGEPVRLLDAFFQHVDDVRPNMTASSRLLLAEILVLLAGVRPRESTELCSWLRSEACPDENVETLLGGRKITHDEVLLTLAWPVMHAAMGVQDEATARLVIAELAHLVGAEENLKAQRGSLPNDGKRAAQLVERVLVGGPEYWVDFSTPARDYVLSLLRTDPGAWTPAYQAKLEVFCDPLLAVERSRTKATSRGVTIERFIILNGGREWTYRAEVLSALRDAIANHPSHQLRLVSWRLLAHAHMSALRAHDHMKKESKELQGLRAQLLDDLTWAHGTLTSRLASVEELSAARELWTWHQRFDKREDFRRIAADLESVYLSNSLSAEFEPLKCYDAQDSAGAAARAKAAVLCAANVQEIDAFVSRALVFFKGEIAPALRVATSIGDSAATSPAARDFTTAALQSPDKPHQFTFATVIARLWLATLRRDGRHEESLGLTNELIALAPGATAKSELLAQVFGRYLPEYLGEPSDRELALLHASASFFLEAEREASYLATVGWSFVYEWGEFKEVVHQVLLQTPSERRTWALNQLLDSMDWGMRWLKRRNAPIPEGLSEWLLGQLLLVPDLDNLGDMGSWHIEEMLKTAGKVSVAWLLAAIQPHMGTLPFPRRRLSAYVRALTPGDLADKPTTDAVKLLLSYVDDTGRLGHSLPRYARDLDPDGVLIPDLVVAAIATTPATAFDEAWKWARFGGGYPNAADLAKKRSSKFHLGR
ncbi:MAG: ATP-binding protein, partial [Myxococcota bacterium]